MPRFSTAFYRRKSTADDLTAVQPSPESPSFRVLERHPSPPPRAFDGGARMARTSGVPMHKPSPSELDVEDNIFAGLNNNRANRGSGSGASNTTKATSTDNSSRHSNASTAPSSADMANTQDDRGGKRKPAGQETMPRPLTKSSTSSFLDRAGRTFSFGIKNKHHTPPPKQEDVPPLPTFQREDEYGRTRAMTASTTSTATPPKLEEESNFDLGGDFGSMFSKFDKRASVATLRMDGKQNPSPSPTKQRPQQPGPVPPPLDIGATKGPVDSAPPSWNSQNSYQSRETLMSPPQAAQYDQPPPVPRHQPSFEYRSVKSPGSPMEDEDARLLADSVAAGKFLTTEIPEHAAVERYRRDEDDFTVMGRGPGASDFSREDNMFAGTSSQFSRTTIREAPRPANASSDNPNSRVMTPAEFERYRRDKEREGLEKAAYGEPADDDDDEDPINYDDEEDEDDKLKQQAKQRRNQQAQMTAYRQRNMKTTGELATTTPISPSRPTLGTSLSAPHLAPNKTPSPEPGHAIDEDEDEDVPLAILQAHGFPNKGRAPSRLTSYGSNPNLRASMMLQPGRPASVVGDPASQKRFSTLPAFARGLPQDPFVGAGIARPAVRESMSFGIGSPQPPPQQSPPMHPGGLIGVIATEERNRAMRRGSPNLESQRAHFGGGMDPMMFNGGMRMPPQQQPPQNANQLSVQDQAQLQMSQQMSSFLQMQMQFMQMMAGQQPNGSPQMLQQMSPPMMQQQMMGSPPGQQQPYGGFAGSQSVADFQSGQSFGGSPPLTQPRRMDASMRTMSMIQPSSSSFMQPAFGNGMGPGAGYSPSIAPSERSNIGLPGRYRPVSQAGSLTGQNFMHQRTQSMSGATALSSFATPDDSKVVPTVKLVSEAKNSNNHSDDEDDEEGWAAMKAKREQKKSRWRLKKGSTDLF